MATKDKLVNLEDLKAVHDVDTAIMARTRNELASVEKALLLDGDTGYLSGWTQGNYNLETGSGFSSTVYCRITDFQFQMDGLAAVTVKDGYVASLLEYNADPSVSGAYVGPLFNEAQGEQRVYVRNDYHYCWRIRNVDQTTLAPANVPADAIAYNVMLQNTDKTLTVYGQAADANITGEMLTDVDARLVALESGSYIGGTDIGTLNRQVVQGIGRRVAPVGTALDVDIANNVTLAVSNPSGETNITDASVDLKTFIEKIGTSEAGIYEFIYDGAVWRLNEKSVVLGQYGISITGMVSTNDRIVATVSANVVPMNVLDHDYHTPVNGAVPHTCTVGMRDCFQTFVFDEPEALFYVDPTDYPDGLSSGNRYYIEVGLSTAETHGNYGFTPTQNVPAGGYVRHNAIGYSSWTKAKALAGKFITYNADFTQIEQLATDDDESGTKLGTSATDGDTNVSTAHVNLAGRNAYGCNRIDQSNWLQYANAEGTGWFKKQNEWDFPPANVATLKGLLTGLDPVMKAAMVKVKIRAALSVYDGGGYVDVETKVFPLSMTEIGLGKNNSVSETSFGLDDTLIERPLAFFDGATDADRIKTLNGSARIWFLRGAVPSTTSNVRLVNTSGALSSSSRAYSASGLVAAWVIGNPVIQSA